MPPRPPATSLLLAGLAAAVVGCGGPGGVTTAPTTPPATDPGSPVGTAASTPPASTHPPPASATPPSANAELFAFTAQTVSGEQLDGSVYGGRDVAVWFWAPW